MDYETGKALELIGAKLDYLIEELEKTKSKGEEKKWP